MAAVAATVTEALDHFGITDAIAKTASAAADKLVDVINDPSSYAERRWARQIIDLKRKAENDQAFLDQKGDRINRNRRDRIELRIKRYGTRAKALAEKIAASKQLKGGAVDPDRIKTLKRMLTQIAKEKPTAIGPNKFDKKISIGSHEFGGYVDRVLKKQTLLHRGLGDVAELFGGKVDTKAATKFKSALGKAMKKGYSLDVVLDKPEHALAEAALLALRGGRKPFT